MPIHRQQYGNTLNTDRKRALHDIAACRTPFFGGHVYQCDHCREKVFSYHSCRNRSCPKCHQDQTERWLSQQRQRLLPCSYFLVTFTLPAQLRPLARSHPKKIYGLLMKAAADALQLPPRICCFHSPTTLDDSPSVCLRRDCAHFFHLHPPPKSPLFPHGTTCPQPCHTNTPASAHVS